MAKEVRVRHCTPEHIHQHTNIHIHNCVWPEAKVTGGRGQSFQMFPIILQHWQDPTGHHTISLLGNQNEGQKLSDFWPLDSTVVFIKQNSLRHGTIGHSKTQNHKWHRKVPYDHFKLNQPVSCSSNQGIPH